MVFLGGWMFRMSEVVALGVAPAVEAAVCLVSMLLLKVASSLLRYYSQA